MSLQSTRLAQRLAALASIDLASIDLTGLAGKGAITVRDVAALLPAPDRTAIAAPPGTRNERLALAKRATPHFYQSIDVALDSLLAFAAGLGLERETALPDLAVLATARLLRRTPALNAAWQEEGMLLYDRVDILLARAGRTILIADADRKGLRAIARSVAAAEDGEGTFAIADFAATGILQAAAIVDPRRAGVLALGAPQQRAAARDGGIAVETFCRLTLSADHRVIDGAAAAQFLSELKNSLESPLELLL
ncbi:MAG: 2-oxo acid dehydrogenase subunit E2 [Reyranellaceae bacterium]